MIRHQTFSIAVAALVAGITISRDNVKVTLQRGVTPTPIPEGELLDGIPGALYDVDPKIVIRKLPSLVQERRGITGPWAPLPSDILGADWTIHSEEGEALPPAAAPVADEFHVLEAKYLNLSDQHQELTDNFNEQSAVLESLRDQLRQREEDIKDLAARHQIGGQETEPGFKDRPTDGPDTTQKADDNGNVNFGEAGDASSQGAALASVPAEGRPGAEPQVPAETHHQPTSAPDSKGKGKGKNKR